MATTATATSTSAPTTSPSFQFAKLRSQLESLPHAATLAVQLTAKYYELWNAGAVFAARRLEQLDTYSALLPAEALLRVADTEGALVELEEVHSLSRRARKLGVWRNILALVPLFLTWLALSSATSAYHDQIAHSPNLVVQPFLVLWENRFGGYLGFPWLTFSGIASLDVLLFLALIVITWLIHLFEGQARQAARASIADLERMLTELVAVLATPRIRPDSNPKDWAAAVQKVIERAMTQTRELVAANQKVVQDAQKAVDGALGHTRELAATNRQAVEDIAARTHRHIQDFSGELRDALNTFATDTTQFLERIAADGRDLLIAANSEAQRLIQEGMNPLVTQLDATLASLQGQLGQYQTSASALTGSVSKLGDAADVLAGSAKTYTDTAKSIDTHLSALGTAQTSFVQQVSGAAHDMKTAADAAQTLLAQINGPLASNIQHIGANVTSASSELASVESQLRSTSSELARAAKALNEVSKQPVIVKIKWPWQH